ncbi:MAG: large subunit ribosomal protein L37Ae [Candidatus Woesearchaeota archaeon]|jgi:large subunit ribosomal protein L37Ae
MAGKKIETAKRYGTRYGGKNRQKVHMTEKLYKHGQKCPYCQHVAVKRLAAGIFACGKCGQKMAGKAYELATPKKVVEEK